MGQECRSSYRHVSVQHPPLRFRGGTTGHSPADGTMWAAAITRDAATAMHEKVAAAVILSTLRIRCLAKPAVQNLAGGGHTDTTVTHDAGSWRPPVPREVQPRAAPCFH